jgi:ankyrin repeat protein
MPLNMILEKNISKDLVENKGSFGAKWYWDAAYQGSLRFVPEELIELPALLMHCNGGKNAFHAACINGTMDKFPERFLTDQSLTSTDREGNTCFHLLAYNGKLSHLPKNKVSCLALSLKNRQGYTSYHSAAINGKLSDIFRLGLSIDKKVLGEAEDLEFQTPLHLSARTKTIDSIPKKYLDRELLSKEDGYGNTVYHIAAQNACIDQIPRELITEGALTKKNKAGLCPVDYEPCQLKGGALKKFDTTSLKRILLCVETLATKKEIKREILIKETKDLCTTLSP